MTMCSRIWGRFSFTNGSCSVCTVYVLYVERIETDYRSNSSLEEHVRRETLFVDAAYIRRNDVLAVEIVKIQALS